MFRHLHRRSGAHGKRDDSATPMVITYDRLLRADREPHNWLTYSGNYSGHRYSPLSQINRGNVKNLQLKWSYHPLYAKNTNAQNKMENTPLVVDGIMYTGTALEVVALDAVTGREYWKLNRALDPKAYYNAYEVNKGLAIAGEHAVLGHGRLPSDRDRRKERPGDLGQDAGRLPEGLPVQRAAARRQGQGDPRAGHQRSGRQLLGVGLRRQDRQELWRFDTAPNLRGCARSEDLGRRFVEARRQSDLERRQLRSGNEPDVLGHRQSQPGLERRRRTPADNLYSASVIALDADTGKLKWHYQFTPGDEYDWDATQVPVLVDMEWQGKPRKLMLWANRNGFFYVLDRVTGKFLMGKPFVKQTWSDGIDDERPPDQEPRVLAQADGRHRRVPRNAGRHQLVSAVLQPAHGTVLRADLGQLLVALGEVPGRRVGRGQAIHGIHTASRHGAGRRRPPDRANPAFKREDEGYGAIRASIRRPARRSGTSRW